MRLDITSDFQYLVKQKRGTFSKRDLLKPAKKRSQLFLLASSINASVEEFWARLLQVRHAYLQPSDSAFSMTEREREEFDAQGQAFYVKTSHALAELQEHIGKGRSDQILHEKGLVEFLNIRFTRARIFHKELRNIRLRHAIQKKEMLRRDQVQVPSFPAPSSPSSPSSSQGRPPASPSSLSSPPSPLDPSPTTPRRDGDLDSLQLAGTSVVDESEEGRQEEEGFSPAERMALEKENESLMREFTSMIEEVRQAESKILHISQLQAQMDAEVLRQATQIDDLHTEAIETTETIKKGNKSLNQATKSMSSSRKFILAFTIMLSLALLFLDWYG